MDVTSEFFSRLSIFFFGIAVLGFFQFWSANNLFDKLKVAYPKYYEKIGQPQYDLLSMVGRVSAARFVLKLYLGVPKDFPSDSKLRLQVNLHRAFMFFVIIVAIPGALWLLQPFDYLLQ